MRQLRKWARIVLAGPDLLFSLVALLLGGARLAFVSRTTPHRRRAGRRLLVLDAAYSLSVARERDLLHTITVRDLDGFFEHVWSAHPLTGADPTEPTSSAFGRATTVKLNDRHSWIEGHHGLTSTLRMLPMTNLVLAQLSLLGTLMRIVRSEDICVIRIGDPYYLALLAFCIRVARNVPLIVRINGNYDAIYEATGLPAYPRLLRYRSLEKRIERRVLQKADLVVAPNQDNLQFAIRNGARPSHTNVFKYGNLIHPIHFVDPSASERSVHVLNVDPPLLVCVSRLEPVKCVEDFVDVIAWLRDAELDVSGVLIGEGSLRDQLKTRAVQLGIDGRFVLAGSRPQAWIACALRQADVVVAPMMGRALVEAALSATPIVAYDVDWHRELIRNGISGLMVPFREKGRMAQAVKALLEDPKRGEAMGRAARADALRTMNPSALNEIERGQYAQVLGNDYGAPDAAASGR